MTESRLRDGSTVADARLGRLRHQDRRSLNYPVSEVLTVEQRRPRSYTWSVPVRLDQGREGACVGFGWAHELAGRPVQVPGVNGPMARSIYHDAQRIDPWEGGDYEGAEPRYEGTSVLAGAQVVKARGFIGEYRWCTSGDDLRLAVGYKGPCVIGVDWYEGMLTSTPSGYIHPTGAVLGGHCLIVDAVKVTGGSGYFSLLNSWGADWGVNGRCRISFADFEKLIPSADMCIPMARSL